MAVFTKGLDLYRAQMARFASAQLTMRQAHKELADAGLKDAKDLTSGTLTPSQTRGAFARDPGGGRRSLSDLQKRNRGLGKNGAPLLPINIQSRKLHDSMRLKTASGGTVQRIDLTQEDPGGGIYRIKPGGTYKMVDSGFSREIRRRWQARNKAFIDHFRAQQRKST